MTQSPDDKTIHSDPKVHEHIHAPRAAAHPELTGWKTHVEYAHQPSLGERLLVEEAGKSVQHAADSEPHATDHAVKAMRLAGMAAGFIPGPGTIAATALNGLATTVGVLDARSRGDSDIGKLESCGATSTALSALPFGGTIGQAASATTGAALSGHELVHDINHGPEKQPELCRNYIVEAGEHVTGIGGQPGVAPPATPTTKPQQATVYGKQAHYWK